MKKLTTSILVLTTLLTVNFSMASIGQVQASTNQFIEVNSNNNDGSGDGSSDGSQSSRTRVRIRDRK